MKKLASALSLIVCLAAGPVLAADAPASEASIQRLIEVTNARKTLDTVMAQMDDMMQSSMQQAMAGQQLTPEQEQIMSETQTKMANLLKDDMRWESLSPLFIEVYRKTFTEKEVAGMLAFYRSKAGQAVVAKMPQVTLGTTQAIQGRMTTLMPKLQKIANEGAEKMMKVLPQQDEK